MLALKKISPKKLAVYVSIMVLMLGGTGYMLYLNNSLSNKKPLIIDSPAQFTNFVPGPELLGPTIKPPAKTELAAPGASLNAGQIKKTAGLDIGIFSSEKFKELKQNVLIQQEQPAPGKRDPFKPN